MDNVEKSFNKTTTKPFVLNEWHVDPLKKNISNDNEVIKLPNNALNLLMLLCENHGKVVSRQKIMEELWPNTIVTDESVSRLVADLRKFLGDSVKKSLYITTVSKQGYCLTVEPTYLEDETPNKVSNHWLMIGGIVIFVLIIILLVIKFNSEKTLENDNKPNINQQYIKSSLAVTNKINRRPRINKTGTMVVSEKWDAENKRNLLFIYDLNSHNEKVLFSESTFNYLRPAFSNSGEEIVYVKLDGKKENSRCFIEIYNFLTNKGRVVKECKFDNSMSFSWMPGDKKILTSFLENSESKSSLITIDAKSGTVETLLSPQENNMGYLFPRISKSGKYIAFIHIEPITLTTKLAIYHRKQKTIRYLNTHFNKVQQVIWGKDDQSLFYADIGNKNNGLWFYDLNNDQQRLISNEPIIDFDYNSKNNFFVANTMNRETTLWLQQDGVKRALENTKSNNTHVSISNNGSFLTFNSNLGGSQNTWLKSLTNKQLQKMTGEDKAVFFGVDISKNDRYLSYLSNVNGKNKVTIIDLTNNDIVYQLPNVTLMTWSKQNDNTLFIYQNENNKNEVLTLNLTDLSLKRNFQTSKLFKFDVTASGEFIVQYKHGGKLFRICCANNNELEEVTKEEVTLPIENFHLWNVVDSHITIFNYMSDSPSIKFFTLQGEEIKNKNFPVLDSTHMVQYELNMDEKKLYFINLDSHNYSLIKIEAL